MALASASTADMDGVIRTYEPTYRMKPYEDKKYAVFTRISPLLLSLTCLDRLRGAQPTGLVTTGNNDTRRVVSCMRCRGEEKAASPSAAAEAVAEAGCQQAMTRSERRGWEG